MFSKGEDLGNREQVQPFFIGPGGLPNKNRARGGQSIGTKETVPEAVELWDYGIMDKMSWLQTLVPLFLGILLNLCLPDCETGRTDHYEGRAVNLTSFSILA